VFFFNFQCFNFLSFQGFNSPYIDSHTKWRSKSITNRFPYREDVGMKRESGERQWSAL
jgi:hypothetical protein